MAVDPHLYSQILAHVQTAATDAGVGDMQSVLEDTYRQGYMGGTLTARLALGEDVDPVTSAGWEAAADKLLSDDPDGGLAQLLEDASVTIRSIADNRMGELATRLAYAIADGASMDDVAATIADVLDDPEWADVVATTETARAMTQASLDTYAANGVPMKQFLTTDDDLVDSDCQDNEDEGPIPIDEDFGNGDPPVHPNCRCTIIPYFPDDAAGPDAAPDETTDEAG